MALLGIFDETMCSLIFVNKAVWTKPMVKVLSSAQNKYLKDIGLKMVSKNIRSFTEFLQCLPFSGTCRIQFCNVGVCRCGSSSLVDAWMTREKNKILVGLSNVFLKNKKILK